MHRSFRLFTSSRAAPVVIAAIISAVIFVALVLFVKNERQVELAEWQKRGVEETNRVAGRVGLVIASIEQILLTVTRELEGRSEGDTASYWTSREFQEKLRFSVAGFRNSLRASIFDANGILQAISLEHPAPYLNLADSEWFKSCLQHDGNGVRPVGSLKTQFDRSYVLVFCSVIRGKAGAPICIAVAALRKQLIDNALKSADPYGDRNYVLVLKDGTILSSVAGDQSLESGRKIPQAQFLQNYNAARDGLWTTAPGTNQRLSTGRLVFASGMIQELPIIVGSSISGETVFKHSNEELVFVVPAVLALIIIIIALGVVISKYNAKNDALLAESQKALAIEAKAKQQAEIFAQEKNRFYSLVSHDIRTPLMAIQTATELLRLSKDSTANRNVINVLAVSSAQLSAILESVLTVNSAEMPDVNMTSESFSLRQLLLDIIETCRMASPSARIVFQSLGGPAFPEFVYGRKNVLGQVVLNILTNAIKYSGEKQITVSLMFPKVMSDDVSFRISIIDQGPGMEQALIEKLFLPYERGESARATKDDGLGLGLWIADRLVGSIQGKIEVESEIRRGSAFHISATMSRHVQQGAEPALEVLSDQGATRLTVLLAEDSASIRLIVASFLHSMGHTVVEARDGNAALESFVSQPFNLVVADLDMPGLNGFDLVEGIRHSPEGAAVPVIILTGMISEEERHRIAAMDIQAVLQKPVSLEDLRAAIRRATSDSPDEAASVVV